MAIVKPSDLAALHAPEHWTARNPGELGAPLATASAGRQRGEIEADRLRVGERLCLETLPGAPAQIVAPVGGIGAVGVRGRPRA